MQWSEGTKRDGPKNSAAMEPPWNGNRCLEGVGVAGGSMCGCDVVLT